MSVLKISAVTLFKRGAFLDGAATVAKHVFPNLTKRFPRQHECPLPVDLIRTICELAAQLDKTTRLSLLVTSKVVYAWVAQIHFQCLRVCDNTLLLFKKPGSVKRISAHILIVSLVPPLSPWLATDYDRFLKALPNLIHVRVQGLRHSGANVLLPCHVSSIEGNDIFRNASLNGIAPSTRAQIKHIYSELNNCPKSYSLSFPDWSALTHLLFGIEHSAGNNSGDISITQPQSNFPISAPYIPLPSSIVSCILMDSCSVGDYFQWAIDKALVDLVLGDTDPRIVYAAAASREEWVAPISRFNGYQARPKSQVKTVFQDAILYHGRGRKAHKLMWKRTIWEDADEVRKRRADSAVRQAAYRLLELRV
ncbi:hypothetical protein DL96DRAFT_1683472 [Flagelloscypha sp. PMI_526]|nr:hypothetical protein DL96DRAFT_1683472 [Flagelloscypha sp. PMI_526]